MQRNISMTISLSQKYDKITYFICNPQTKFIVYEKAASFLRRGSLVLLFVVDLFNIQFFFNLLKNLSVLIDILEKILLKFKKYIYNNLTKLFILYTLFLL